MADKKRRVVIDDLRGGRNGYDPPWAIKDTECVDAVNVDWYQARLANKRSGMLAPTVSAQPFTAIVSSMFRHVPGTDETAAELWGSDSAATPVVGRLAGGTAWATPTLKDNLTGNGWDVSYASFNGLLMMAYKSAVGRLHCWDTSTVRRTGVAAPSAACTVANNGAGAYPANLRYYRHRFTVQVGGVTVRRSEYGASVSFTPSGAGAVARVTVAGAPGEGETHWEVEGSSDNVTFYVLGTIVIGTTIFDDNVNPFNYSVTYALAPATGLYTLQKPYKFIAADQGRLIGFGSYTATDKQNDLEISTVLGTLDVGDAERVDTTGTYRFGLDENDSGFPTGLVGPVGGAFLPFKNKQVWLASPTGNVDRPYRVENISKSIGALSHRAIDKGEDAAGNAVVYWMSHRGPYMWGLGGMEYIGHGIEDLILGPTSTINLAATFVVAHTTYYPDKRQVWFWFATGSSNDANNLCLYDVVNRAWSRVPSGDKLANARCSCLFSTTIAATMSRDLKPYVGQSGAVNRIWKADTGTDDNGTAFQGYVITKAIEPGGPGFTGTINDSRLLAKVAAGVTISDTITRDFGLETKTATCLLSAEASETRVDRRLEDSSFAGAGFIQHQLGDGAAVANAWTLDRLMTPLGRQEATT